jgi:uncharacterized membrane protein (UPF0136 family)
MRSDINISAPIDPQVEERLAQFARSTQAGVWNHLDKQQIVRDLRVRLINPFAIEQGEQPFCGPAAVVFELIRKQPLRYIEICQNLYERGSFEGYVKPIRAAGRLCRSYGNLRMAQADWMLMATLRDCANKILPVHPKLPKLLREFSGGMTKPWEMSMWARELLGYSSAKSHPTIVSGEFRALQAAEEAISSGGVAFALINSHGLLGTNSFVSARLRRVYPTHWVTLLGNLSIDPPTKIAKHKQNRVKFDIYSWGQKIHVNADTSGMRDFFWGVTIGQSID